MPKLSIVIPCMNQLPLVRAMYKQLRFATDAVEHDVEFVIIDNGSTVPITDQDTPGAKIVRNEKSIGVYPTFGQGFKESTGDVVAFFHSDLIVWEDHWNNRVVKAFKLNDNLGMIGFIGSNQIDQAGGRGLGTTSNFQGRTLVSSEGQWSGSAAAVHGKVSEEMSQAAVVDGCSMIIRRKAWDEIGTKADFPIHHFYDRLISTQLLEKGWGIYVMGVACDHISGQTVNAEDSYKVVANEWLVNNGYLKSDNPDHVIYQVAEAKWLTEYRDVKHMVPITV